MPICPPLRAELEPLKAIHPAMCPFSTPPVAGFADSMPQRAIRGSMPRGAEPGWGPEDGAAR